MKDPLSGRRIICMTASTYSTWPFGPCRVIARPGVPELRVSESLDALVKQYVGVFEELAIVSSRGATTVAKPELHHHDVLREVGYNMRAVHEVLLADRMTEHAYWLSKLTCLPNSEMP